MCQSRVSPDSEWQFGETATWSLLGPHDLFQPGDDFFRRQAVGGDFDRIVGLHQGADRPVAIALVADLLIGQHFVERDVLAAGQQIAMTAAGPFLLRRP